MDEKLLMGVRDLAAELGISRSTVYKWDELRLIPEKIKLGGKVFWKKVEISAWVDAGCPGRGAWRAMKDGDIPMPRK